MKQCFEHEQEKKNTLCTVVADATLDFRYSDSIHPLLQQLSRNGNLLAEDQGLFAVDSMPPLSDSKALTPIGN
jgi:hypothetical protein